jgi:hypothetical protein
VPTTLRGTIVLQENEANQDANVKKKHHTNHKKIQHINQIDYKSIKNAISRVDGMLWSRRRRQALLKISSL